MNVFIVEDSATMLKNMQSILSDIPGVAVIGHAVDEAGAIERINALRPDVVTLDLRLKTGSGLGVLENIRKHHAGIKVMVLTNCSEKAYIDRCIRSGADYFFDKSFQYTQFCDALRNLAYLERIGNKPGALQMPEESTLATQQPKNHLTKDCKNCLVRPLGGTAIVECLMEAIRCHWAVHFRDGKICKHPSVKQLTISNQP